MERPAIKDHWGEVVHYCTILSGRRMVRAMKKLFDKEQEREVDLLDKVMEGKRD